MNRFLFTRIRGSGTLRCMRPFIALILLVGTGFSGLAQDVAPAESVDPLAAAFSAIRQGDLWTAEKQMEEINDPAAKLFVKACIEKEEGELKHALETVTQCVVLYPNNPDWTAKSELMSVLLYMELGMLDAADVTSRQVQRLYEGTDVAAKATALRSQIEQLKKEMEKEGNIK